MAGFRLCPPCAAEYADPESRRFHAQPNACPVCGPRLVLKGPAGNDLPGDPVDAACEALAAGGIVALLGVGGFHLACDATREDAVAALRRRKDRPAKPLAVMVPDRAAARAFATLDPEAEKLLAGPKAPILLLPARGDAGIAPSVAPGQDRLGLFLPYTPLHHLIFRRGGFRALVMTSGNRSDEPILATWEEARDRLKGVVDLFVLHDRPILHRVDDSVVKPLPGGPTVLRRARGYAPAPLALVNPRGRVVLALGAELANTFAVVRGTHAYLGPHVGDLKNLETEEAFRTGIRHLLELLRVEPDLVVCDLHPQYVSSRHAAEWEDRGVETVRVQHHEAHAAACLAEHRFEGEALVLALDGLGYGSDGTLWGGELLAGRSGAFRRVAHLACVPQPGGDRAAREPWRMAASHLRRSRGPAWTELPLSCFGSRAPEDLAALETMMARGVNAPLTSSCGRLFDAAAAILGFSGALRYSAQAAMELEALAARCPAQVEPYPAAASARSADGPWALDPSALLEALVADSLAGRDRGEASLAFHTGLAGLLAEGAAAAAEETGLSDVFLTGGCLQNAVFARGLAAALRGRELRPRFHRDVPPNDGGIAFGQAAWALGRRE
jgi:hydrogenase maturation protein HypF